MKKILVSRFMLFIEYLLIIRWKELEPTWYPEQLKQNNQRFDLWSDAGGLAKYIGATTVLLANKITLILYERVFDTFSLFLARLPL